MDIHYNAFISYRHHPDDIRVAMEIHRGLERFKIPKAIRKKSTPLHLFRDKEELPITSHLTEDITRALENSEFLIVICSPPYERICLGPAGDRNLPENPQPGQSADSPGLRRTL